MATGYHHPASLSTSTSGDEHTITENAANQTSTTAAKMNQLLQVAQKCQNTVADSGSDGVSQQDLQSNSNMI